MTIEAARGPDGEDMVLLTWDANEDLLDVRGHAGCRVWCDGHAVGGGDRRQSGSEGTVGILAPASPAY